jgi:hypothetical protein
MSVTFPKQPKPTAVYNLDPRKPRSAELEGHLAVTKFLEGHKSDYKANEHNRDLFMKELEKFPRWTVPILEEIFENLKDQFTDTDDAELEAVKAEVAQEKTRLQEQRVPVIIPSPEEQAQTITDWVNARKMEGVFSPNPTAQAAFESWRVANGHKFFTTELLDTAFAELKGKLGAQPVQPVLRPRGFEGREPPARVPTAEEIAAQEQAERIEGYRRTLAEADEMDASTLRRAIRTNPRFVREYDAALQWRNAGGR